MKKKCIFYKSSEIYDRHVYFDLDNAKEILEYVTQNERFKMKFEYILDRILEQKFSTYDDYKKLTGYKDISEMRFFPNKENGRIYCKEVKLGGGTIWIIASKLLVKKKSNNIDKSIKAILASIEKYEYEIV